MRYVYVFLVMTALDFVWAAYTASVSRDRATSASLSAAGIMLLTSFVTRSYVEDWTMVAPSALGAVAGTALAMRWRRLFRRVGTPSSPAGATSSPS